MRLVGEHAGLQTGRHAYTGHRCLIRSRRRRRLSLLFLVLPAPPSAAWFSLSSWTPRPPWCAVRSSEERSESSTSPRTPWSSLWSSLQAGKEIALVQAVELGNTWNAVSQHIDSGVASFTRTLDSDYVQRRTEKQNSACKDMNSARLQPRVQNPPAAAFLPLYRTPFLHVSAAEAGEHPQAAVRGREVRPELLAGRDAGHLGAVAAQPGREREAVPVADELLQVWVPAQRALVRQALRKLLLGGVGRRGGALLEHHEHVEPGLLGVGHARRLEVCNSGANEVFARVLLPLGAICL